MTMKGTIVYPDHLSAQIEGPMGNITMVATPKAAFMAAAGMGHATCLPGKRLKC